MSHRKFEAPRHGHLGFTPRKRCSLGYARIKAFPRDDSTMKPHVTTFMGYKAGMTHILREVIRPGSKLHKKDVVEPVTIVECPDNVVVGVVGYEETLEGLKQTGVVYAPFVSGAYVLRVTKGRSETNKFFEEHNKNYDEAAQIAKLDEFKKKCCAVRVLIHTTPAKIRALKQKRAHVSESAINGGSIAEKVDFAKSLLGKPLPVNAVFAEGEQIDCSVITKGHGFQGVIKRWGVKKLPRKTHRGLRKVACIGAWHPARVQWTVARAGQLGYHHRVQTNLRIYKIGNGSDPRSGSTNYDLTEKTINPISGFKKYGFVQDNFLMIKGSVGGPARRMVNMRKAFLPCTKRRGNEEINIKFIDTASKLGTGRYQTHAEKKAFLGVQKKDKVRA